MINESIASMRPRSDERGRFVRPGQPAYVAENLTPNVRAYASERQLLIAETLGSGKDGIVWVAKRRSGPAKVALKAHRFVELYLREKAVSRRLE